MTQLSRYKLFLRAVIKYNIQSTNDGRSRFWWQRKGNVLPKQLCCCHLLEPCSQVLIMPCRRSSYIRADIIIFLVELVIFSCVIDDLEVSCPTNFILCYISHKSLVRYLIFQMLNTFICKIVSVNDTLLAKSFNVQIQDHMKEILMVLLTVDSHILLRWLCQLKLAFYYTPDIETIKEIQNIFHECSPT